MVLEPPVSIKKSITASHLISMEDGRPYKSLKRHLTARGPHPGAVSGEVVAPFDYPMVAPNYSKARSELAKAIGLGQNAKGQKGEEARGLSRATVPHDCPAGDWGWFRDQAAATPRHFLRRSG